MKNNYKLKITLHDKDKILGFYIEKFSNNPYLEFPIDQDNITDYNYKIEIIKMSDEEYSKLPEFGGF